MVVSLLASINSIYDPYTFFLKSMTRILTLLNNAHKKLSSTNVHRTCKKFTQSMQPAIKLAVLGLWNIILWQLMSSI